MEKQSAASVVKCEVLRHFGHTSNTIDNCYFIWSNFVVARSMCVSFLFGRCASLLKWNFNVDNAMNLLEQKKTTQRLRESEMTLNNNHFLKWLNKFTCPCRFAVFTRPLCVCVCLYSTFSSLISSSSLVRFVFFPIIFSILVACFSFRGRNTRTLTAQLHMRFG